VTEDIVQTGAGKCENPPGTEAELTESAVVLANGLYDSLDAKTAHGMVRGPCRYHIVGVVDASCAGGDAGTLLDGRARGIPVFASVRSMLTSTAPPPDVCVVGIATSGGRLPPGLRDDLVDAAEAGMTLVSGMHQLLADDPELADITRRRGRRIIDFRRPRPPGQLRFWSGEVLRLQPPRVPVLGTDCVLGKRTTCCLLLEAFRRAGTRAEMVYTGQTGWLQGIRHGFILDATPNDFVCGELEGAILECARESRPEIILIEGQSSLRNPSGPCGAELILAAGARGVVLQHAPAREYFDELEKLGCRIPPLAEEVELIRLLGAEVWAVTLNEQGLSPAEAEAARSRIKAELGLPVYLPLRDDLAQLAEVISERARAPGPR
jgi:uncharacterized NAD-dependent epimerase/dehydratase family protein